MFLSPEFWPREPDWGARLKTDETEGVELIAQDKEARINGEITSPEVRVIGATGEPLGILAIAAANKLAEEAELDLVEIAPQAKPPVCRIMDYGKYKYRESKKRHEAKLKQKQIVVKEIKFRPGTDEGDYQIKLRNLIRFLEEGDKTKVTLRFRGREMAHQEIGIRLLERVRADLEPHGVVEQFPKMEGRQLVMVLSPKKGGKGPPRPVAKAAAGAAPRTAASAPRTTSAPRAEAPVEVAKK
jgi:translation initiation factor IF-3